MKKIVLLLVAALILLNCKERPTKDESQYLVETVEPKGVENIAYKWGHMALTAQASDTITLKFPTFTKTAEMAGISRVLGGYHIQSDNIAGLELGRNVAHEVWGFYKKHVGEEY